MKKLMTLFAAIVAAMSMSAVTPVQKAYGDAKNVFNQAILNADTVRMKLDQQGFTCLADEVHQLVDTGYLAYANDNTINDGQFAIYTQELNQKVAAIKALKDSMIAVHDTAEATLAEFVSGTLTHEKSVASYTTTLANLVGDTDGKVNLGTGYDYWKGQCYNFYKDTVMQTIDSIRAVQAIDFAACQAAATASKTDAETYLDSCLYTYAENLATETAPYLAAYDSVNNLLNTYAAVENSTIDDYSALHTWHTNMEGRITAATALDHSTVVAQLDTILANAQDTIDQYIGCEATYYTIANDSLTAWRKIDSTLTTSTYSMASYTNNKALYDFYLDLRNRIEELTDTTKLYKKIHEAALDTFHLEMAESRKFYTLHRMGICNLDEYRNLWDTYQKYDTLQHINTCQEQIDSMRIDIVAKRNYLDSIYNVWAAADSTLNAAIAHADSVVAYMNSHSCYSSDSLAAASSKMKGLAVILEDTTVNYCFADTMDLDSLNTLIAALELKTLKDSLLNELCIAIYAFHDSIESLGVFADNENGHATSVESAASFVYFKGEANTVEELKGAINTLRNYYTNYFTENQKRIYELPETAIVNVTEDDINYTVRELSVIYTLKVMYTNTLASSIDTVTRTFVATYGEALEIDVDSIKLGGMIAPDSIFMTGYALAYKDSVEFTPGYDAPARNLTDEIDLDADNDSLGVAYTIIAANKNLNICLYKAQSQQNGVATGIQNIMNGTAAAGIYTIEGIRINELKKGVNIIVKEDGTFSKKLVF